MPSCLGYVFIRWVVVEGRGMDAHLFELFLLRTVWLFSERRYTQFGLVIIFETTSENAAGEDCSQGWRKSKSLFT